MKNFGIWILLSFALYYIIELIVDRKGEHVMGALIMGMILSLGIVLTFF